VDDFKKNIIYFDEQEFVMNNIKTRYSFNKLNVVKILGKGSFKIYIKDRFKLELPNDVFYINIGYEGATE